jgi:hypothetical protein
MLGANRDRNAVLAAASASEACALEVEAEALIGEFGDRAYSEARRKEGEASSDHIAALALAAKTGRRVGLDTSTRMATDADFATDRASASSAPRRLLSEIEQLEELARILGEKPPPFRIQFLGAATNQRS